MCTYQEAANIERLLLGLRRALPDADVLIVDDDSPDGTADLAKEAAQRDQAIHVHVRSGQRGLGGAIVHAAKFAVDRDYDFFLNLDGDLSHAPTDLPRLLELTSKNDQIDVVVGSRYIEGGRIDGWPLRRKIMSRMVNWFAVRCLRLPVSDCSGSIRCYRVDALRSLDLSKLRCRGYALLEELLMRLKQQGCQMAEVPITFTERQDGYSKLTISEAVRSISFMLRLAIMPNRQ